MRVIRATTRKRLSHRLHHPVLDRIESAASTHDNAQSRGDGAELSLAAGEHRVVQEMSHIGNPSPSLTGADRDIAIRNRANRHLVPEELVDRCSSMAASSALEWPENERMYAALIPQIAEGDDHALAHLYDRTSRMVYGLCLRIVKDPSAAEDITLEAYLQVWRTAESYDPGRGTVSAWLLTVVRSRAIDWLRARKARRADLEQDLDEVFELQDLRPSPERASMDSGRTRIIQNAIAELPEEQRRAIELTYFAGLSHSEVALQTGLPIGTVKTRVRLGVIRLRELLGPYGEGL
jgi:RNA polymerase sigma-70 factor (ECF subfamily)